MAAIVIRNIPDEDLRALKIRAAEHNRSTEAEVRGLIAEAVRPAEQIKLGSEIAAFGEKYGGIELDITRDQTPARIPTFE